MTTDKPFYRIADAARLTGVSASTLRLWENQGLVRPSRTAGGQRQYSEEDIALLLRVAALRSSEGLNAPGIRTALLEDSAANLDGKVPRYASDAGRRLRVLRREAGKTLGQVARDVGLAASALSTFERTSLGISFKALHDLAHYYGTTVSSLSGESHGQGLALVRATEWRIWPPTTAGVTVQVLAEGANQMDCHRFVLAPGASSEGAYRHDGEEFMHLISGRLEVVLEHADVYDLGPGDSLYFESRRHHAWTNRNDGETIILWINTPPSF